MKFTLPLPPPLNQTYRVWNGRFLKSQIARDWEEAVAWSFKKVTPLNNAVIVEINLYLARDRDIDSSIKLVLDVMEKMGVYKNDKQIEFLTVKKFKDKENPRMEVEVLSEELIGNSEDSLAELKGE